MKCARCEKDCNYPDRTGRICPNCRGKFAFEPRLSDPINDMAFKALIERVSAGGKVRFGKEHVYYEYCRYLARKSRKSRYYYIGASMVLGGITCASPFPFGIMFAIVGAATGYQLLKRRIDPTVPATEHEFNALWSKWTAAHEDPNKLIVRPTYNDEQVPPGLAADLQAFSFDRAVICDRARTVDMLIANNFHFENNCAILSIEGYPKYAFKVVKKMLRENPRLTVYALHDATGVGCRLAHKLSTDPEWFKGRARVVDVGIRPVHARKYRGYYKAAESVGSLRPLGITAKEVAWTSKWQVELAVLPPEQVIKRLHKAIITHEAVESREEGDFADASDWDFDIDCDSFDSPADAADGGADGFG